MNTNFWWFKVDATGVKEPALVQLTKENMVLTLGEYIINPDNRNVLSNIPPAIKNIEKRTKNNIPGSNEVNMEYFGETLEKAFADIMSAEVRDLVNKHIDKNSELFKQMKVSSETWKLEDLLDSQKARDFSGSALSLDKDISRGQKKLLNRDRHYTNKEFFKDYDMSFKDGNSKKSKLIISLSHLDVSFVTKEFKKVFPKSSVNIIDHPRQDSSSGGGVFVGSTPFTGKTETSSMHGIRTKFDTGEGSEHFPNWAGLSVEKQTIKYLEYLDESWKAKTKTERARLADIRRHLGLGDLEDKIQNIKRSTKEGIEQAIKHIEGDTRIPKNQKPKRIKEIRERKIIPDKEAKNMIESLENKLAASTKGQKEKVGKIIERLITQGNKQIKPVKAKAMSKFDVKLSKSSATILKDALKGYSNKKGGANLFQKFTKSIIDDGVLYKHLVKAHNMDFTINDLSDYKITIGFTTDDKPNKYGEYTLNSTIREVKNKTVDVSSLMTGENVTSSVKPYIAGKSKTQKERAYKTRISGEGFNRARNYFITLITSNIEDIQKSATNLNVTLED